MDAWSFMDRWWRFIQAHRLFPDDNEFCSPPLGEESVFTISLVPRETAPADNIEQRCRALRDALELVFLQSVVDHRVFVHRHFDQGPNDWKRGRVNKLRDDDWRGRWDVKISLDDNGPFNLTRQELEPTWIRAGIWTLLTPQPLHERGQVFQDARRQLLLMAEARRVSPRSVLTVGISSVSPLTTELAKFVLTGPPPALDYPFRSFVVECDLYSWGPRQHIVDVLACLDDPHGRIQLGSARIDEGDEHPGAKFTQVLIKLLRPAYSSALSTLQARPHVERTRGAYIDVKVPPSLRLATQLGSTVMHARGVESLSVDWASGQGVAHPQPMRWIMLSLFSGHTSHSIRRLRIRDFPGSNDDAMDFNGFFQGTVRIGGLCGGQTPQAEEGSAKTSCDQVFLASGTNLRLHPMSTNDIPTEEWNLVQLHTSGWMDVVDTVRVAGYYEVLVPAYGICRVFRTDVKTHRTVSHRPDHGRLLNHRIKSLSLEMSERRELNYGGLYRFLHLVGAPLKKLSLSWAVISSRFLVSVLQACPSVTTLELSNIDSNTFVHVVEMYKTTKCTVTSLKLRRIDCRGRTQHVVQFCKVLSDPERSISRTLTKLVLDVGSQYEKNFTDDEVIAIAAMLERNSKLISCSVAARGERADEIASLLHANGDPRLDDRRVAPLALRSKLAFLSVIFPNAGDSVSAAGSTTSAAMATFDCYTIARIFEMAAVRRKVLVTGARLW